MKHELRWRWVLALSLLGVVGIVNGGCSLPTTPSAFDVTPYWSEVRVKGWLKEHQQECSQNYVNPLGKVEVVEGQAKTCLYANGRIILNPIFAEGCATHELGHAALDLANNKCWRDFEHDGIFLWEDNEES